MVYGSRAFTSHTAYSYWYVIGNRLVTLATNVIYNCYLSDMETGYKVMPREVALSLDLQARGFELEPEITAKLLRSGHRIYEVPISYAARSRTEGKKLTAMDGVRALRTLARCRGWHPPSGAEVAMTTRSEPALPPRCPRESETPPGQAAPNATEGGRPRPDLAVLAPLLYLAVALAALRPGLFTGHDSIVGTTGDPSLSIWALQWIPFALSHHLNPLFTSFLHYPTGVNLMWNSSILFPSLVLSPVTVLWGPIVSYNFLTLLSMWLSGWCAFLAVRRYSKRWVPAAVGGLLYQFSPFLASQITVHAQIFVAVFPPLLVLLLDEILVRQRRRAWLIGGLLGLATAAQLLTGTEVLAISVVMCVPALITLAVIFRARLRERLGYALRAGAAALAVFAVLAGYPLYFLLLGPQRVSGQLQGDIYMARPQAFVIPSKLQLLGGPSAIANSSVYIGIPLLLLLIAVTVWMRRRPAVVAAAVTVACTMVLALGDFLAIREHCRPTSGCPGGSRSSCRCSTTSCRSA